MTPSPRSACQAQAGRSEQDAEMMAQQQGELKASKRQMDKELDKLKSYVRLPPPPHPSKLIAR